MASKYFKNHPSYRKGLLEKNDNRELVYAKFEEEFGHVFQSKSKDIKILEIGLWRGDFALFCSKKGYKNYTGIDIDDTFIGGLSSEFKWFSFLEADIVEFLKAFVVGLIFVGFTKRQFPCEHFIEYNGQWKLIAFLADAQAATVFGGAVAQGA